MHVILPPLEEFTAADLREGTAARAIIRNNAITDCAAAIRQAGGTYSHAIPVHVIYLDDGLRVDSPRCPELGPRPQLRKIRTIGAVAPTATNAP